jgi:hypothetical protein
MKTDRAKLAGVLLAVECRVLAKERTENARIVTRHQPIEFESDTPGVGVVSLR